MKETQIISGLCTLLLLILIPIEKDYGLKSDMLGFIMVTLFTFLFASHFVGLANQEKKNGKK